MAHAVSSAMQADDADLDDSELLLEALMELERSHFHLLERLRVAVERSGKENARPSDIAGGGHLSAPAGLQRVGAIEAAGYDLGVPDCGDATGGGSQPNERSARRALSASERPRRTDRPEWSSTI